MTLAATTRAAAEHFGDRAAVVAGAGWSVSYRQLDELSDEVAAGLAEEHGVREGDLVALVLPSTPDYVVAYAALAKLGAITAGVNPRATTHERNAVLTEAQPTLIIAADDAATDLPADVPVARVALATRPDDVLARLRGAADTHLAIPAPDPDRLVTVVFTSGTTGQPKGAMFGEAELAAVTRADLGPAAGDWGGGGPMLAGTECAHVGLMTKLPTYLRLGATVFLLDRWRAADVLHLIHTHRMATVGGVAPQVALLLRQPDFDQLDLSCVKAIVMGGSASSPALVREARERFGAPYSIRYSSTESGGIGLGTAFDADDEEAFHTVGRPRGDVQVKVCDPDAPGLPVPDGEVGELYLRSSTMMRGYWRKPAATAEALVDGWLRTGDLASIGADGLVRLAGRAKEMFIRGGYNVYPMEVEAVLATHPAVSDVVVVPRPDPVMGELGVAVVVPVDPEDPPTLEALRAHGAERLAAYKLPEALRIVGEIPLTPMQKQDRRALAAHEREAPTHE